MIRVVALALALCLPAGLSGQVKPSRQTAPSRAAKDTLTRDTMPAFAPPDSVMAALLARTGFTITRYEGEVVTFDAETKALGIAASSKQPAMVEREGLRVRTDSMIVYSDARQNVSVTGRYEIVPGGGQQPISGAGTVLYDVGARSGRLTNATVTVNDESSERWFITSKIGKTALGDSARKIPPRFYGLAGTLTSCDDSIPDYHFRMQEIKRTEKNLVARPAVLYIKDIPVMWLPFVFQDIRPGRRSGILPPRLGVSDIVRNNPSYRRHIENLGYHWAMSDYTDLTAFADWRSGSGGSELDPGWLQLTGESNYKWNSRFLGGRFAFSYMKENSGSTRHSLSWNHNQRFGKERTFNAIANYTSNTTLQRRNTLDPAQAMATIGSTLTYQDKIGPASLTVGAAQTQYPGRTQIERTLPTVTVATSPISLGKVLTWTPGFDYRDNAQLKIDQQLPLTGRLVADASGRLIRVDSLHPDRHDRTMNISSPITVFGFKLDNNFGIRDEIKEYPEELLFYPDADSSRKELRIYGQTYQTSIDWNPTFTLPVPAILQSRFKILPSVSLQNVDGGPFWIRNQFTGGRYVNQAKRLTYGVSTTPTIFGILPGFGPFQRFRHTLSPSLSFQYAPAKSVSTEYLEAISQSKQVYLGALAQNSVSFGLNQNIEAKLRSSTDTGGAGSDKLKILTMALTPLSYDFERARFTGRKLAGITTEQMGMSLGSDLLPRFGLNLGYSLFEGSTQTDTARFDPQLTSVSSQLSLSRGENPFTVITRLFGRAVPDRRPTPQTPLGQDSSETAFTQQIAARPVAGQASRGTQFLVAPASGWEATMRFSSTRPRKLRGDRILIVDPTNRCAAFRAINIFAYEKCLLSPLDEPLPQTPGGVAVQMPNQTSMQGDFRFAMTQHWSASWNTSYDFELAKFAAHTVSLQRDLHDFRAIFAFTHSPNGNFAFNFFIALKPQPDLKFDYSKATIRSR